MVTLAIATRMHDEAVKRERDGREKGRKLHEKDLEKNPEKRID